MGAVLAVVPGEFHRPAHGAAELIAPQRVHASGDKVARIQLVVAQKFE